MDCPKFAGLTTSRPLADDWSKEEKACTQRVVSRRQWIHAASAVGVAHGLGCRNTSMDQETKDRPKKRSDIPIRILFVGSEEAASTIQQAWRSVAESPVKFSTVSTERDSLGELSEEIFSELPSSDIVIFPLILQAELATMQAILPEADASYKELEKQLGKAIPALRSGASRLGGKHYGHSLGSRLQAVLSSGDLEEMKSWSDYHGWVSTLGGKAAEPLAKGWAAQSYLQRAASSINEGWLFHSDTMSPEIVSSEFVAVLEQLLATADQYIDERLTPSEIWQRVRGGSLDGGIGFEPGYDALAESSIEEERDVAVADLPNELASPVLLLDELSPIAAISSACRQTAASKKFLSWISGGEGSRDLMNQITAFAVSRESGSKIGQGSSYQSWLRERLRFPRTRPGLNLIDGGEYYQQLDEAIIRCLDGKQDATSALTDVAMRWESITERVGRKRQQTAWALADGLSRV